MNKNKILDKNINKKNNLKLILNKKIHFNSPKDKISPIIKKLEIPKIKGINKLNLQELNKKEDISILSEEEKHLTIYSEIDDLLQINKEIENKNIHEENSISQNFKSEINDNKNLDLNNDTEEIKINFKEEEKESNNIESKEGNEKKNNEVENLFEIAKREGIKLKDNKKEIENYAISKGKDLKNLLNKKDTYFSIYRLKQKVIERNLVLEELMFRKGNNTNIPFTKKEKIFLEKNKSLVDEIINQEKKIKEIIIENKFP
jgi:hypothetical protein